MRQSDYAEAAADDQLTGCPATPRTNRRITIKKTKFA